MSRLDKNLIFVLILSVLLYITIFIIKPLNILVLGIDQLGILGNQSGVVGDNGQADFVAIAHIDLLKLDFRVVTIPRETMVRVDTDYTSDNSNDKRIEQICLQYSYGTNSREGAELVQKCLKENFGVDTDCFIACSMGALPYIIDVFGGVDITPSRDYSYGSEYKNDWIYLSEGETVHYSGNEAYDFIHFRDVENYGTNQDRMDRQKDFIKSFRKSIKLTNLLNGNSISTLATIYSQYVKTDITMYDVFKAFFAYEILGLDGNQIIRVDGVESHPGRYDEYEISETGYQLLDELQ